MATTRLRTYFMAILPNRRVPIRIAKANIPEASRNAREWWIVRAKSVKDARALCLAWPRLVEDPTTRASIVNHNRKRG